MSWIVGTPNLSDSSTIESPILLFHNYEVVLLVSVLPLFVEVDHFLVHLSIEQFEILETSLDVAVFLGPIVSSAVVVQRTLVFVVAKRLPRVVLEDSIRCVCPIIGNLASILPMLLPFPILRLLPLKTEITVPFVFRKIFYLLHVRVAELASARCNCVLRYVSPKY